MAAVTIDRVAAVRQDIADAVNRTLPGSTLPVAEQDRMLEQACGEACALLGDCLDQPGPAPSAADDAPFVTLLRDREFTEQLSEFLSPLFADALRRGARAAGRPGEEPVPAPATGPAGDAVVAAAHAEVAQLLKAASATGRRFPTLRRSQVLQVSTVRIGMLRDEVCQLTAQLRDARQDEDSRPAPAGSRWARLRRGAVSVLKRASVFFLGLTVSLSVSVAGPQQAVQDLSAWTHSVTVVVAHDLAAKAQPALAVTPHQAGPRVR